MVSALQELRNLQSYALYSEAGCERMERLAFQFGPHWKEVEAFLELGANYWCQVGFTKLSPLLRFRLTNNSATQPSQ